MTLSYDALDRLVNIERPQVLRVEFFYDASHRRLAKKVSHWNDTSWGAPEVTRYLYCSSREVGALGADDELKEFRVLRRGKGAELGASVGLELDGALFCPIHDHRGNITALVNTITKEVEETYRYSAFGEEQLFSSAGEQQPSVRNPWRFASKRSDPETGFVFFGRRYYSRSLGRFLTPDPVGFSDGPNLYAYVHNSPLVLIDPYGLMAIEDAFEAYIGYEEGKRQGAWRGFTHPFDTLSENSAQATTFYQDACRGDFSKFSGVTAKEAAKYVGTRTGEVGGVFLALAPVAEMVGSGLRGFAVVGRGATSVMKQVWGRITGKIGQEGFVEGEAFAAKEISVAAVEKQGGTSFASKGQIIHDVSSNKGIVDGSGSYSTSFRGNRNFQLESAKFQASRNAPTTIQGRQYSDHAIDQMQNRGIPFSSVENAIRNGSLAASKKDLTRNIYYDQSNNVSVVVQKESEKVVTVCHGELK